MAQSLPLFLAIIFTVLQIVTCTTFRGRSQNQARGGPRKAPLQWWVLPIIGITGFVVTLLVLYFIKKLFSGQRTIKIRNSLRNRPQSPWRTTNNDSLASDPDSDIESGDAPPEYEHPPSYIEVTKEFQPPPPPAYDVIFKGGSAAVGTDLLAELPVVDTELGARGDNLRRPNDDSKERPDDTT